MICQKLLCLKLPFPFPCLLFLLFTGVRGTEGSKEEVVSPINTSGTRDPWELDDGTFWKTLGAVWVTLFFLCVYCNDFFEDLPYSYIRNPSVDESD